MPDSQALLRIGALVAIAGVAAAAVALWPAERRDAPVPLDVREEAPPASTGRGGPEEVVPRARVLPPKEGFATQEEATLLASALDKVDLGLGAPLPPATGEGPLDWDRVLPTILGQPGIYLRWESEALKADVLKMPIQITIPEFPAGAPKDGLLPWGPLFAEIMHNGFKFRFDNPVIWIGRGK